MTHLESQATSCTLGRAWGEGRRDEGGEDRRDVTGGRRARVCEEKLREPECYALNQLSVRIKYQP